MSEAEFAPEERPSRRDRRRWLQFMGIAGIAGLFAPGALAAKKKKKGELTEEELQKAYAETEKKVAAGSTPDRPGIASWNMMQGVGLVWPAKYYLPYPAGHGHQVYQSWNGNKLGPPRATHMKAQNYYAWDFHITRGQYICAARDGKVVFVDDGAPAGNERANVIRIEHKDREQSVYAHVGSNTSLVAIGDKVLAGQKICQGSNEALHLHFVIWKGMIDYPCRFIEVKGNNGVPQYGQSPASGNKGPDKDQLAEIEANYRKGEEAFKNKDYLNALKFYLAATETEILVAPYEKSLERIEECRGLIDTEVTAAIAIAKNGDFDGCEKSFKAIKKKYGDYAKERINVALDELQSDPAFKQWVAKQRSERLWIKARTAKKFERWDEAERHFRALKKLYKKGDPEYKLVKKHLTYIQMAKILDE